MKYVGIKRCQEKRDAIKRAKKEKRVVTVLVNDLIAKDCERHLDILKRFDKSSRSEISKNYRGTPYWKYYEDGTKVYQQIINKVHTFRGNYERIMEHGFNYKKGYIIVSTNGIRLDGSHRAAILYHLKIRTTDVLETEMVMTNDLKEHLVVQKNTYC